MFDMSTVKLWQLLDREIYYKNMLIITSFKLRQFMIISDMYSYREYVNEQSFESGAIEKNPVTVI